MTAIRSGDVRDESRSSRQTCPACGMKDAMFFYEVTKR